MNDQGRRKFLKFGFIGVASMFAVASPIKFDANAGFSAREGKLPSVKMAEAHAMCGIGMNCGGGGGQCGMGMNCSGGGGGGQCGMGMNCGGSGGRCGMGMNCSGG